jgi:transcription initiation factor IIF auxiliary subunit
VTIANRPYSWLWALGGLFMMIGLAAAQAQDISTANTSRYVGNDRWDWTVYIKASPDVLRNIRCVEYKLHSTFPDPNRKVCSLGDTNQPFALKSNGWGTFDVPVRVVFKNGKTRLLRHKLSFEPSRQSN